MPLQTRRIQAWSGVISDRPGAAAAKLANLAAAGADLEFLFTRPNPAKPDTSVLFLAPISEPEQIEAARAANLGPALDVTMLCVTGVGRPTLSYDIMSALAIAGINLRGISVSNLGRRFIAYLAFDDVDTATAATQVLAEVEA